MLNWNQICDVITSVFLEIMLLDAEKLKEIIDEEFDRKLNSYYVHYSQRLQEPEA